MSSGMPAPAPPKKRRSGSQKRRVSAAVRVNCLPEQRAQLDVLAARAGQTVSALCLNALLGVPMPPPRRAVPTADGLALVRASGVLGQFKTELSRVGSNLNQLAHHLNAGRDPSSLPGSIAAAVAETQRAVMAIQDDIRPACRALLDALGVKARG